MIRVMLCDDHPLLLRGLADLIAAEPDMELVGCAADGMEALGMIAACRPDVAVIDLALPRLSGLEVLQRVNREQWPVRVVLLTACISDLQVVQALSASVAGIVLKEAAPETLTQVWQQVFGGARWLPSNIVQPAIARASAFREAPDPIAELTPREREITQLITDGRTNREIASALSIGEGTVKTHLNRIYSKLYVNNRTAVAIMFARKNKG